MVKRTLSYSIIPHSFLLLWGTLLLAFLPIKGIDYVDLESCDELTEFVMIEATSNELPNRYKQNQLEDGLLEFFESFALMRNNNGNNSSNKRHSW
jgi:hypothetical protein